MGEDALVRTPCPQCGRVNSIDISRGEPLQPSELALWLPDKTCSSVVGARLTDRRPPCVSNPDRDEGQSAAGLREGVTRKRGS